MRRRQIYAMRAAEAMSKEETKHEEVKVQEAPKEVLSFKGLTACPNCKKEMKRGIAMHYKHCIKRA